MFVCSVDKSSILSGGFSCHRCGLHLRGVAYIVVRNGKGLNPLLIYSAISTTKPCRTKYFCSLFLDTLIHILYTHVLKNVTNFSTVIRQRFQRPFGILPKASIYGVMGKCLKAKMYGEVKIGYRSILKLGFRLFSQIPRILIFHTLS